MADKYPPKPDERLVRSLTDQLRASIGGPPPTAVFKTSSPAVPLPADVRAALTTEADPLADRVMVHNVVTGPVSAAPRAYEFVALLPRRGADSPTMARVLKEYLPEINRITAGMAVGKTATGSSAALAALGRLPDDQKMQVNAAMSEICDFGGLIYFPAAFDPALVVSRVEAEGGTAPWRLNGTTAGSAPVGVYYRMGRLTITVNGLDVLAGFLGRDQDDAATLEKYRAAGMPESWLESMRVSYETMRATWPECPISFDSSTDRQELVTALAAVGLALRLPPGPPGTPPG